MYEETDGAWHIVFRPDPQAIRDSVTVNERELTKEESGGYVFVPARYGAFTCYMGNLIGNRRALLCSDKFSLK